MTIEISPSIVADSNKDKVCVDFDHVVFYVSSPALIANYLVKTFGFSFYAFKGLETGSRNISATVIKNGNVIFILLGAIQPLHKFKDIIPEIDQIHKHIATHGDSVKDVAFKSNNLNLIIDNVKNNPELLVNELTEVTDNFGTIKTVSIKGINDTIHTFVDRSQYKGFLPGYKLYNQDNSNDNNSNNNSNNLIEMNCIDHCVQNEDWNKMLSTCDYYKKYLNFHVFWSVDENQIHTEYSALKSTVMVSENEIIKMPINEPAIGLKKSQIEEFIEFNNGPGIQHIAIKVDNIIETIKKMRDLGVKFIDVPDAYYENLEIKLKKNKHPKIKESLKSIKKLGILVDFDENGYLLQLFTKPIFERPTFFFEIIQRFNHNGFGAGNFKGLFEVLEKDQEKRGNLTEQNVKDRTKGLVIKNSIKPEIKTFISDDDIADAINYLNIQND